MIIDFVIAGFILLTIYKGFGRGFVPSLLGLFGYVSGGLLGLVLAKQFTSDWSGFWSVIGVHLAMILIGAKLGQGLARALGKGVRGIIGPFKLIDSLLGGLLSGAKAVVIVAVTMVFASAVPNDALRDQINESQVNTYVESHLPGILEDALSKITELAST